MKTKKEILEESLDSAKEAMLRIEITTEYLQGQHAKTNDQHLLQEMAKLKANENETKSWIEFLNEQLKKEK